MRINTFIKQKYNQTHRFREIITILIKYGLTDFVKVLRLDRSLSIVRKLLMRSKKPDLQSYSKWERVRMAIEELGPTFIKLGQLMSNRNDMLPEALLEELIVLQDKCPPLPEDVVRKVIRKEFGKPVEAVFTAFEWTPVASASIAQVHRAALPGGQPVAVKIQRPGIQKTTDTDLEILHGIASLMERYIPDMKLFHPTGIVKEFRVQIKIEMNFNRELLHIQKFSNIFTRKRSIKVPEVYREYTTRKVLTMEFIEGEKVAKIRADLSGRYNKKLIAFRGANLVLEQVFIHGFFHADPHPGNILVLKDSRICFLDFGMMGRIRPKEKDNLTMMFLGMTNRDAEKVAKAILNITRKTGNVDFQELEVRIFDLLEEYIDLSLEDFELPALFNDLISLIRAFGLIIPANLMLMIKALIAIEAIGEELDPSFNLMRFFKPFARRLISREFHPKKLMNEFFQASINYKSFLEDLPIDAGAILKEIKNGDLKLNFRLKGLERFRVTLDRISYRLIYGIVISSILISSSLIIRSNVPPVWNGISVIGLGGILIAVGMGLSLVIGLLVKFFRR